VTDEPIRVFELHRVPLAYLHEWLEARGLRVVEHSVDWGEQIIVEVRDDDDHTDLAIPVLGGNFCVPGVHALDHSGTGGL